MTAEQTAALARPGLLIAAILLLAASLRAPVAGLAPVLGMIRDSFALSTATAGALTTLPLLAFALGSPFAILMARRFGLERSLFAALLLIASGIALRSAGPLWSLFVGTAIIGTGIALGNVLLPSLLKRDFPARAAALTGAYALVAGLVSAVVSAAAVPIATVPGSGWQWALGSLLLFPMLAIPLWLPFLGTRTAPARATVASQKRGGSVWHSRLAWQVTLFFGLNSLVYFVSVAWLPTILTEHAGLSAASAGSIHGLTQLATAVPGLVFGPVMSRLRDQKGLAICTTSLTGLALLGLILLPGGAAFWAALFGFASGTSFILGLTFFALRSSSPDQAAALSGMAQSVGYLVAALAPPVVGLIHDRFGGWTVPLSLCVILCAVMALAGSRAGRDAHVG